MGAAGAWRKGGFIPFATTYAAVCQFVAPMIFIHRGDRRRASEREDSGSAAGPDDGLWPKPPCKPEDLAIMCAAFLHSLPSILAMRWR
ncbi:hypothetical protein KCP71_23225 [Salmonella enterica subsp. enterica]|nr:hypothetical protein KCP71_23225 [Salmonella enterica subsp. enterica]